MTELKWGILGPGRIAHTFATALPHANRSVIQAVHSRDKARADTFAQTYQIPTVYSELDAFFSDPEIDIVYIAYPHRYHADAVAAALNAGKHVLCEKPLAVTASQAQALISLAQEKNLFLMEAVWSRFLPTWQQVRRWLDEGLIGDIKLMSSNFSFAIPEDKNDRLFNIDLAGGTLLDMGVYCVTMSQFVSKQSPSQVSSAVLKGETGVDVQTSGILAYSSMTSQFTCGFLSRQVNSFSIYGSLGRIVISEMFWGATKATLIQSDKEDQIFENEHMCNGFEYQIMEVEKCIANGQVESEIMPWRDTLAVQSVMDEILAQGDVQYPFLAQQG